MPAFSFADHMPYGTGCHGGAAVVHPQEQHYMHVNPFDMGDADYTLCAATAATC